MSAKSDDNIIAETLLDGKKIAEKKQLDILKPEIIEMHPVVEYEAPDGAETMSEEEMEDGARNGMNNYFQFKTEYALIVFGNDVRFAHKYIDDSGNEAFVIKKKSAVRDEWADRKAFVQVMSPKGEIGYIPIDVAVLAIDGANLPGVTEYAKEYGKPMRRWQGTSFCPGSETDVSYNRFRGFPITAKKGDVSRLLEFLEKAFGKEGMDVILTFFASMYQHPQIKLKWMLALIGEKGLGKNTVEEILGRMLLHRENYVRAGNKDHLFNKFNAIFEANLLTVGQEIVWSGDQKHDSILKEWITESTRTIERKGIDPYTVDNCSRILMTSNEDWVVPASGKQERRYAVLRIKDIGYTPKDWERLYQWADDNLGAIMEYLVNYPLEPNYHAKAPYTKELANQLRYGLTGIESYIFDGISNGYFGKTAKNGKDIGEIHVSGQGVPAESMFQSYIQTRDSKEKLILSEFGKKLSGKSGSGKPLLNFESKRIGKRKQTTYFIGSRKVCADIFYRATGVEIHLEKDDLKWAGG